MLAPVGAPFEADITLMVHVRTPSWLQLWISDDRIIVRFDEPGLPHAPRTFTDPRWVPKGWPGMAAKFEPRGAQIIGALTLPQALTLHVDPAVAATPVCVGTQLAQGIRRLLKGVDDISLPPVPPVLEYACLRAACLFLGAQKTTDRPLRDQYSRPIGAYAERLLAAASNAERAEILVGLRLTQQPELLALASHADMQAVAEELTGKTSARAGRRQTTL